MPLKSPLLHLIHCVEREQLQPHERHHTGGDPRRNFARKQVGDYFPQCVAHTDGVVREELYGIGILAGAAALASPSDPA
jgi:hypothetical protein